MLRVVVLPNGCVEYLGGSNGGSKGQYRTINENRKKKYVHRVVWEHHYGPIPDGLTIDHMCGFHRCVNIDHLRLMTPSGNCRAHWWTQRGGKCRNGIHDLSETGEWKHWKGRDMLICMACYRENAKRNAEARARADVRGAGSPDAPEPPAHTP